MCVFLVRRVASVHTTRMKGGRGSHGTSCCSSAECTRNTALQFAAVELDALKSETVPRLRQAPDADNEDPFPAILTQGLDLLAARR